MVLTTGVRDVLPPRPPLGSGIQDSDMAGMEGLQPKKYAGSVRVQVDRALADHQRLGICRQRLCVIEWIMGYKTRVVGHTYEEFLRSYNKFALSLLYMIVGQIGKYIDLPDEKMLFFYRARRCFVETEFYADPLDYVRSYTTEYEKGQEYTNLELHKLLSEAFKERTFLITRLKFQAVFSNKATLEYDRPHGGFNATVGMLASLSMEDHIPLPPEPTFTGRSLAAMHVAEVSHRDKTLFCKAVNASISIMRSLKRRPMAFVFIIPERSGKARVPTLPEGFAGVLSRYVSGIGKEIQKRMFPITTDRGKIRMRHVPGSIYLSGDYKDSTSFLGWDTAIVGWFHIFTQAGMERDELSLHMEIIKFLIGPHDFFSEKEERARYQSIFGLYNRMRPSFKKGTRLELDFLCSIGDFQPPLVGVRSRETRSGMCRIPFGEIRGGFEREYTEYPAPEGVLESLLAFRLGSESITSIRGLIMAYSIAAPALHVAGAIPHWKFREVTFLITGDDNASRHPNMESIDNLETEKRKTLMVPHDSRKSARGPRGLLLAEDCLVVTPEMKKGDFLVRVKNFPIRILFPQSESDWHAITMPEAAYNNFKEVSDQSTREKIIGFIYWKYKEIYDELADLNVTVFGENGLFPDRRAPRGFLNSPGGYTAAQVFKRSGPSAPSFTSLAASALIAEKHEVQSILEGTVEAISNGTLTEVFKDLDDLRHSMSYLQVETPYRASAPSGQERGVLAQVRKNLEDLEVGATRDGHVAIGPHGEYYNEPSVPAALNFENVDIKVDSGPVGQEEALLALASLADEFAMFETGFDTPFFSPSEETIFAKDETGVRSNFRHHANFFTDALPKGADFKWILQQPSHHFIDVKNLTSGRSVDHLDFPDLIGMFQGLTSERVVWLVMEVPGRAVFMTVGDQLFVRATPRRNGRAGADLEFRQLLDLVLNTGVDPANVIFSSWDKDWRRIYKNAVAECNKKS